MCLIPLYLSLFYFSTMSSFVYLYSLYAHMVKLYLNVYCQCLMLTVCTKGLRVTQFQFHVCMYCTCGRIDNKADLTWLQTSRSKSNILVKNTLFCQTQSLASDDTQTCPIHRLYSCLENTSEINSIHCYKNLLLGNRKHFAIQWLLRHK